MTGQHEARVEKHTAPVYKKAPRKKVEPKVAAATAGSGAGAVVAAFLVWALAGIFWHGDVTLVPLPVSGLVFFFVPGVCAFVGGYLARHVQR